MEDPSHLAIWLASTSFFSDSSLLRDSAGGSVDFWSLRTGADLSNAIQQAPLQVLPDAGAASGACFA